MDSPATWWLPGQEHVQVPGRFRVSDVGQPEAELHPVAPDGSDHLVSTRQPTVPVLHGVAGSSYVTLVRPGLLRSASKIPGRALTTLTTPYAVSEVLLGEQDLAVTDVRVSFWDQDDWTDWNAYSDEGTWRSGALVIRQDPPKTITAVHDDVHVELKDRPSWSQTTHPHGWVLESRSRFRLTFAHSVPLDDLFDLWLVPLEVLIISATGELAGIRSLQVDNREWLDVRGIEGRLHPVYTAYPTRHGRQFERAQLLHRLDDWNLPTQLPLVVDAVNRHRYPIEHYVALKGTRSGGRLAHFAAAAQLVESFHRSLHPGTDGMNYSKRLKELSEQSGCLIDDMLKHRKWRNDIPNLRDIVIHGMGSSRTLVHDVRSIQVGTEILLVLFECRLLVEFGFTAQRGVELVKYRANHWQVERMIRDGYPHVSEMAATKHAQQ